MKLTRKSIGRIAAGFVASAMLATMAFVPVSAQTGVTASSETFTVQKALNVKANSFTPNVTFTFTVTPAAADEENNIEAGVTDGVTLVSGATFESGETPATEDTTVTKNATFQVNLDEFTHAGIYKYTVREVDSNYDGVSYTTEVKTLYIHIQNADAGGLEVAFTELVDADGETKSNTFTNYYGTDDPNTPEPEDTLKDVTLQKVISGKGANLGQDFDFTIQVDGDENERFYVTFSDDRAPITLTSGTEQTISLGQEEKATIWGLSANDVYTITETDGGEYGYTTTVTGDTFEDGTYTVTGDAVSDVEIVYTNDKSGSTPTGIMMDIAPYALLVVVAGAACFIFLRKRNKD